MVPEPGAAPGPSYFDPSVKCCTHMPALPNFLVGQALADPDLTTAATVGRDIIRDRIARRVAATPIALGVPTAMRHAIEVAAFGRDPSLRCPYYVDGRCGVWKHRTGACATWFCKHERGVVGAAFWAAVRSLFIVLERCLARYCVIESDVGQEALELLLPLDHTGEPHTRAARLDGTIEPGLYRALWGRWADRELELYQHCSELVAGLRWSEVVAIGGSELAPQLAIVRAAYHGLTAERPAAPLRVGPLQVITLDREAVSLATYSEYDPIAVPFPLLAALARFDGRSTAEVIEEIAEADGIEIDRDLLTELIDRRVLIPAGR